MHSFQLGGVIECVLIVESEDDMREVFESYPQFYFLGRGSNTVLNPNGAHSTVVKFSNDYSRVLATSPYLVVEAGMTVAQLLKVCETHHLTGLEFSAGVPASVGGMTVMNFGCWGWSISDNIRRVKVMTPDGSLKWLTVAECEFGYRSSVFQADSMIVMAVEFSLDSRQGDEIKHMIRQHIYERLGSQPLRGRTFGSVFKNPEGDFAGRLIESLGLKGLERKGIRVSLQHANFFEHIGGASFDDLVNMVHYISEQVWAAYSIRLELEVQLVT